MSIWDTALSFFTGGDGTDTSSLPDLGGGVPTDAASGTLPAFSGAPLDAPSAAAGTDLGNLAQTAATTYGGPGGLGYSGAATPGLDLSGSGVSSGVANSSPGTNLGPIGSGGGAYTPPIDTPGPASTGTDMTGGLDNVGKYLKQNPQLVNAGLNLANSLTANHSVPQGYQTAADVQAQGNASNQATAAGKTAVGNSLIGQAPYLANNALAGSMNSNAATGSALQTQLNREGYHAGDPQYDSAMAQHATTASQNNGTAWAQGQSAMGAQETQGAGLLTAYTPQVGADTSLGAAQQTSQNGTNSTNTAVAANLGNAYNIYAGNSKDGSIKNATDSTGT